MVRPPENYFLRSFWKILVFFFGEKIVIWKIFKTSFLTRKFTLIFVAKHPLLLKMVMSSHKWFFRNFFHHKLKNIHKVFLLESIFIWMKILCRINFVLIKFSSNVSLFEKLHNECKNPSFLRKVTCIRLDHAGGVAEFHIHGFIL